MVGSQARVGLPPLRRTSESTDQQAEMPPKDKVHIVGIGDDGLDGVTRAARTLIEQADLLVGADYTLRLVPAGKAEHLVAGGNLDAIVERIAAAGNRRVVVLVSGDPLFYGLARYLCEKLGKDRFEVVPHVSSMQLAFARVKESWEEAYLTNLAHRPLGQVLEQIRVAERVGLFTSEDCPPSTVAQALLDRRIDYFWGYVCENLGSPDERVTRGSLKELASQDFAPLNVMILVRKPDMPDRPSDEIGRRLVRQSGRGISAIEAEAGTAHDQRNPFDCAGRNSTCGR